MPDRTDADLVAAVRGGDRAAFGEMYERYADRVYGLCLTVLRRPEEAADATHDTFVRVAERLEQLRNPERLRSWMFSIARNEALQRIRRSSRLDPLEDDDDEVVPPGVVDESAEAEAVHAVAQQELSDLVWDASEGLEDRDRAVLDLYVRQGLEGEELGEAMGVSAEYAYQLTRRVRTRIDRALGALLIARLGQDDCDDLRTVLAGWDGTYDPAVRRRVVRHVDNCEICQANRSALVSPVALFAAVPLAPVPFALKAQVLGSVEAAGLLGGTGGGAAAAGGPAGEGSQPSSGGGGGGVPPWMIGLAAVVVAAVVGLAGWLIWNASRDDDAVVEASPTSVPASDPSPPGTSVSPPPPSSAPPATTPPDDSTPSVPTPTTTPTPTTSPAVTGAPTTAEAPTTAPPAPSPTPTTAPSPPPTSAAPLPAPTTTIAVTTTEPPPPVRVDVRPGIIDFGASATTATLTITNRGTTPATFSVASGAPAVAVAPASGSIAAGQAVQIDLTIDRTALSGPLAAELQLSVGGLSVPVVVVASV